MDVKDLNKSQLILLAVLLSFVTSIATGITTVTLMQQAPASFTVPVNRVIKQTIEKIEQVEGKTTVQTIIIKEEDLVVDAIAKNKSAVFDMTKEILNEEGVTVEVPFSKGVAVSEDGIVVGDGKTISGDGVYYVANDSGKFKTEFLKTDGVVPFAFLKIIAPLSEGSEILFTVPTFGDLSKMSTGQKIIVMGSSISFSIFGGNENISLDVEKSNTGGLVLNLDGDALGIALSGIGSSFVSIDEINKALQELGQ